MIPTGDRAHEGSALATGIGHLRCKLAGQQSNQNSEEQLLHAFMNRRDENAFANLVHRHGPIVLHVRRVCRRNQDERRQERQLDGEEVIKQEAAAVAVDEPGTDD